MERNESVFDKWFASQDAFVRTFGDFTLHDWLQFNRLCEAVERAERDLREFVEQRKPLLDSEA